MTALAPPLARFLGEHLPRDQRASPHTCDAYAYSFQLLVTFAAQQLRKLPSQLEVEDIGVPMILSFLDHIEQNRGNTARSRNARLAAIRSFFRFLEYRVPVCLDQSLRIRAIPMKKTDEALVASLSRAEIQALIDSPDPKNHIGRARSRDAPPRLFGGSARLGTGRTAARSTRSSKPLCDPRHRQRAARTRAPFVEGKRGGAQGLARRPGAKARWSAISQRRRSHHDAVRVRIHSRHARCHRREKSSLDRSQAHNAPCSAT